jgi:hypothetical protein
LPEIVVERKRFSRGDHELGISNGRGWEEACIEGNKY